MTVDFIWKHLGIAFDEPCNWTLQGVDVGDYMTTNAEEWCSNKCGKVNASECWKKYFELLWEADNGGAD